MDKIESFKVNHLTLLPGLYVSRVDTINDFTFTTFDLRFTRPNFEDVMPTGAIHAIEHLLATYFRNNFKEKTMYFGPMGCRTGFYLILAGDVKPADIKSDVIKSLEFLISFEGKIYGASPEECGNYSDMDLISAKNYAKKYLNALK